MIPAPPLAGSLDREDVERFLHDTKAAALARPVAADRAARRVADVEARGAEDHLVADRNERRREGARLGIRRPEQMVGQALGRLRADPGQPREGLDEAGDRRDDC